MAKNKIIKRDKFVPWVNSVKPKKKRKNKTITRNVFNCGVCNNPIKATDFLPGKLYFPAPLFCVKCAKGWFGKLVDFFVAFKSFILGK